MTDSPIARLRHVLTLVALLAASAGPMAGQVLRVEIPPESVVQEVQLVDGGRLYGRFVTTADPATFRLASGSEIPLALADIRRVRIVRGSISGGEFRPADPNGSRLFFAPTGRTLDRGSGYLSVFELFVPFVAYAPTDDLVLAGGTPLAPEVIGDAFWLAPKLRVVDAPAADVSLGLFSIFGRDLDGSIGILYGVGTFGNEDAALTAGLGYGYYDDDLADRPVVLVGGEVQVARGLKLLSENWIFPEGDSFISGGVRFFGERLAADLGIVKFVGFDDDGDIWFPIVSFAWNW